MCLQTDKIETEEMNYDVSERAIKDKSLLGTHAQKLCDNIDAYWMMPTCDADSTERMCSQLECDIFFLYKKLKVKEGHIPKERRRGTHLPFIGRFTRRWIYHCCL